MRKVLLYTFAAVGFAASAHAADLGDIGSFKDPLPDTISWHGVTLYGTVDVGGVYQTNAAPQSGALYTGGLDLVAIGTKNLTLKDQGFLSGNGLSQSFWGIKVEENVGYGLTAIAKFESGFNPWSGELANACASLARNNGLSVAATSALDGSRCGQLFNGQAYGGLSSATYGTLTVGRNNSLNNDIIGNYDPLAGSYAFSLLNFSGGAMAGIGTTEDARWDNSVKYIYTYGPVHVGGEFSSGGADTAIASHAGAVGAGFTWQGLSVDAAYTKEYGAVNSASLSAANCTFLGLGTSACEGVNTLGAYLTNNEAWAVAAKYVFDLGGGYKDLGPAAKVTVFGGYNRTEQTNNPGTTSTTIGGYSLLFGTSGNSNTLGGTDPAAGSTRVLQTAWAGVKYETGPWAFIGAYYHEDQNQFISAKSGACPQANSNKGPSCAGDFNQASFVVDYTFTKHFDVYAGVSYSAVSDGLANGYVGATNTTTVMSGLRIKF